MSKPASITRHDFKGMYIKIRTSAFFQWAFLFTGWIFLYLYLLNNRTAFEFKWVVADIAAASLVPTLYVFLQFIFFTLIGKPKKWEAFIGNSNSEKAGTSILPYKLPLPLKLVLGVPAEDGLFLVPLFYFGVNFLTAFVSATFFAVAHYPAYKASACIPKGLGYFIIALFIFPQGGIEPIIVGHYVLDLIVLLILMPSKGPYKLYYADGTLKEEGVYGGAHFGKRVREGITKIYYPNGKLHREFSSSEGKFNGKSLIFFENGHIKSDVFYINGVQHGLERAFHENGNIAQEAFMHNGVTHGLVRTFNPEGTLIWEGNYEQGVPHGLFRTYREDGTLEDEVNFVNGRLEN